MGKVDEDLQAIAPDSPAPPPYSEAAQGSYGQAQASEGEDSPTSIDSTMSAYRPFPLITGAYYQWKMSATFHLGESADQRLYAVSTHIGWGRKGRPGIILHNGSTNKDPMLAAAGEEPGWNDFSPNSVMMLPPLPGSPQERCTELMRAGVSEKIVHFRFSIEVGHGKKLQREDFVWQTCKGEEAKKLVDEPWECGFKLMRLPDRAAGRSGEGSKEAPSLPGEGQEILAVFAWNRGWSLTNPFRIQFVGSGRRAVMGERWELMVVITALRLWWLKRQGRVSPNVVVSGEAGIVPGATG